MIEVHIILVIGVDVMRHDVLNLPPGHVDPVRECGMREQPINPRRRDKGVVRRVVHHVSSEIPRAAADEGNRPHRIPGQQSPDHGPHGRPREKAQADMRPSHLVTGTALTFEVLPGNFLQILVERIREHHDRRIGRRGVLDLEPRQHLSEDVPVDEDMVGLYQARAIGALRRAQRERATGVVLVERLQIVPLAVDDPLVRYIVRLRPRQLSLQELGQQNCQRRHRQCSQNQRPVRHEDVKDWAGLREC
mmetsp:Transcript_68947/g.224716  ORF Transcript_68947/g.224716 Transcript_68947/m.224716 type:complete len:248 (-) Transcript_68947:112-855(-)